MNGMPLADDAELAVLGAMLLETGAIPRAAAILAPDDFWSARNQKVFQALIALYARNETADLITLAEELGKRGELEPVGGVASLSEIMEYTTTSANVEAHAQVVLEHARRRRAIKVARDLGAAARDRTANIGATLEEAADLRHELESGRGAARVIPFSQIPRRAVDWLWRPWIPLAMVTAVDGDPGTGKSTVLLDIAARVSRGDRMPDGSPGPEAADVVVCSAEDHPKCVIRPRLDAAGADLNRIVMIRIETPEGPREPMLCPEDVRRIEAAVRDRGAKLVIIDPLMAYLPADVNAHRDQDMRRALRLLSGLAERTGAAVIVVRHLNKSEGTSPIQRGGGSIGIIAAVRSGLLLAKDPDDPTGLVLASFKSNVGPSPASLRLRLVSEVEYGPARVSWGESCAITANRLLVPEEKVAAERAERETREHEARSRAEAELEAIDELRGAIEARSPDGAPMDARDEAVRLLGRFGVPRDRARAIINEREGRDWRIDKGGRTGCKRFLLPIDLPPSRQLPTGPEDQRQPRLEPLQKLADSMDGGPPASAIIPSSVCAPSTGPEAAGPVDSGPPASARIPTAADGPEMTSPEAGALGAVQAQRDALVSRGLTARQAEMLDRGGWDLAHESSGAEGVARCPRCGGTVLLCSVGPICTVCRVPPPASWTVQ
jgi:replicative DNA helicase